MKKDYYYRLVLVFCSLLQIGVAAILLNRLSNIDNWSAVYAEDSKGYILAANYFRGVDIAPEDIPLMRYRLFSPVIPFVAAFLGRAITLPQAFLAINILLWILTALLFYELMKKLLKDDLSALAGGLILTTSLPLVEWGLPIMLDAGAYFFAVIVFLSFVCGKGKHPFFYGLLIGIAVLVKPTLVTLLLFALLCFFSAGRAAGAVTVLVSALVVIFSTYLFLNLSFSDFMAFGGPRHRGVFYLFSAAFFCYHWGWIFFFKGWKADNFYKKYYLMYLFSFLTTFLIFVHNPRLFFLSYPAVIPLIIKGINAQSAKLKNSKRAMACFVGAYIITSNLLAGLHLYVMRTIKIRDIESLKGLLSNMFQ